MLLMLAVDPGYATLGWVLGKLDPPFSVTYAAAAKNTDDDRDIRGILTRATSIQARLRATIVENVHDHQKISMCASEAWEGGKNPSVIYRRGISDAVLYYELSGACNGQPLIVPNSIAKKFLNPRGKAKDNGRKTELEYLSALNSLDSVLSQESIKRVANPDVGIGKWKDGRQHALDAAAIYLATAMAAWFHIDPSRIDGIGTRVQRDVAYELAERLFTT